jgi:hypothetical protein
VYTSLTGYCERSIGPKSKDVYITAEGLHLEASACTLLIATGCNDKDNEKDNDNDNDNKNDNYIEKDRDNYTDKDRAQTSPQSIDLPKDMASCCGTIQLTSLGKWLEKDGYAFWNLGHPPRKHTMKYKRDLGGRVYPRKDFLSRWQCSARDAADLVKEGNANAPPSGEYDFSSF